MADMADIVVYDDATTPVLYTFVPHGTAPNPLWIESSTTKSAIAKARIQNAREKQKNGYNRRLFKVELPIMEQATGGSAEGYVAPPRVAHTVVVQVQMFAHERATNTDCANALKMAFNGLTGVTGAGTGDAFKNATDQGRTFMIGDILPG